MARDIDWKTEIEASLKEAGGQKKRVMLDFSHAPQ